MSREKISAAFSTSVDVKIVEGVDSAPNYSEETHTAVQINTAIIIPRGMVSGRPSVDLQLTDDKGQQYVAMLSGGLFEMITGAIIGVRKRTGTN